PCRRGANPRPRSGATPAPCDSSSAGRSNTRCGPSPHGSPSSTTRTSCSFCSATSRDRKSTRLNSSHGSISYAVFCLKKKTKQVKEYDRGIEVYEKAEEVRQLRAGNRKEDLWSTHTEQAEAMQSSCTRHDT